MVLIVQLPRQNFGLPTKVVLRIGDDDLKVFYKISGSGLTLRTYDSWAPDEDESALRVRNFNCRLPNP